MINEQEQLQELREREKLVDKIVSYPNWQFIIQFERHRDTCSVSRYVFPKTKQSRVTRRRPAGTSSDLSAIAPAVLPVRRSHRIGSRNIDAIQTATRLDKKFLPKLKRQQRGGVDFFYCVEDYLGLNAHASAFVGNVHEARFSIGTFVALAKESGLTIGSNAGVFLVTRWNEQWFDKVGLARYVLKSIAPTRFANPLSVLATSSAVWGYSDTLVRHLNEHSGEMPNASAVDLTLRRTAA